MPSAADNCNHACQLTLHMKAPQSQLVDCIGALLDDSGSKFCWSPVVSPWALPAITLGLAYPPTQALRGAVERRRHRPNRGLLARVLRRVPEHQPYRPLSQFFRILAWSPDALMVSRKEASHEAEPIQTRPRRLSCAGALVVVSASAPPHSRSGKRRSCDGRPAAPR